MTTSNDVHVTKYQIEVFNEKKGRWVPIGKPHDSMMAAEIECLKLGQLMEISTLVSVVDS